MTKSPIDSKSAGQRNEKLILSLLRKHGSLSQTQLCRLVGIGSSTASTIVARLRDKGLVIENRGLSERRGPKPIILSLNPVCYYVIGIEINPSSVIIGIFDFIGQMTDKLHIPLGVNHSPEHVLGLICERLISLLDNRNISSENILGTGITLSGSVLPGGIIHLSSPLGWKDVPLGQMLAKHFQFPIKIYSNRVRLLAEIAADPELASKNILYLNVANGVGSTVYMNGRLVFGATGRYGEIGHNIIDANGPVCGCGHQGCLEAHISGPALVAKIERDVRNGAQTILSKGLIDNPTPEMLLSVWPDAIAAHDAYAMILRDYVAQRLSRCAADAINSYDPDVMILGGYVNLLFPEDFAKSIRLEMSRGVYDNSVRKIEIRAAKAGEDALIYGISVAVLQDLLETAW
jgi:predicted NBD/HSP70 family sugar kinase/biotin operon repressor